MSDIIDLTQEDPVEIIYISDDEPRLDGPEGDPLAARTDAECDPTIKRDGEYPAILVGPCEFINKEGWRERTAPAYLKFTEHSGTAVFAGCHIRKGEPVFIYGGSLVDLEPCSRNNLPSDQTTHVISLASNHGIDSQVVPEKGLTWKYYAEVTRNVAGFSNASMDYNCALIVHPKPDGVANYVLQRRNVEPKPWETPVIAYFRATKDIPKGTQLLWNYRCDPHPGPKGAEMVLVDPNPPLGDW